MAIASVDNLLCFGYTQGEHDANIAPVSRQVTWENIAFYNGFEVVFEVKA
jgi:hypothetical protein